MHPAGGQPEQHIAQNHALRQVAPPLHRADRKAGQIEIAAVIHARHFRRLAADQRATTGFAAGRDAFDDASGLIDVQLAGGEIVEKEQWLRPLADQIVDAHRHQINADAVHIAGVDGDAQLGADPVGGGDQDRVHIARRLEVKKRAKAAEARHGARPRRPLCRWFDPFDQEVAGINVHTGIGIGQTISRLHHRMSPPCFCPARIDQGGGAVHAARALRSPPDPPRTDAPAPDPAPARHGRRCGLSDAPAPAG